MKKLIYLLSVSSMVFMFSSCFEKIDNWYSETSKYDGRYVVGIACEEDEDEVYSIDIKYGYELMIYNSAANVADEIIIDTYVGDIIEEYMDGDFERYDVYTDDGAHIRGKFKISGSPAEFNGVAESENLYLLLPITTANNYFSFNAQGRLANPPTSKPTSAGLEINGIQFYTRMSLETGKITPLGKTTIGGNKSDGIFVKLILSHDLLVYESYEIPQADWGDPTKPEYKWRVQEGSRENADGWEETWVFDGYRYTGYPEDNPNILPPIIEK